MDDPSWIWDKPEYNYLGLDTYSSHVPKEFWKMHGDIDNLVNRWLQVNGYRYISVDCKGRAYCYQWKSTWLGPAPGCHADCPPDCMEDHGDCDDHGMNILEKIQKFARDNPSKRDSVAKILKILHEDPLATLGKLIVNGPLSVPSSEIISFFLRSDEIAYLYEVQTRLPTLLGFFSIW